MTEPITVGVREARANFSRYLKQARDGTPVRITSREAPVVELRLADDAARDPRALRKPGWLKGPFYMADDFDEWPLDIIQSFDRPLE